jgi:hypothetical protein
MVEILMEAHDGLTDEERRELRREVAAVMEHLDDWTYEALQAAFAQIETRFLSLLASRPEEHLNIRRYCRGFQLDAAQYKKIPFPQCEEALRCYASLGWIDEDHKVLTVGSFITYCQKMGRPDLGRPYLDSLVEEVRRSLDPLRDAHLAFLEGIRVRLERTE